MSKVESAPNRRAFTAAQRFPPNGYGPRDRFNDPIKDHFGSTSWADGRRFTHLCSEFHNVHVTCTITILNIPGATVPMTTTEHRILHAAGQAFTQTSGISAKI